MYFTVGALYFTCKLWRFLNCWAELSGIYIFLKLFIRIILKYFQIPNRFNHEYFNFDFMYITNAMLCYSIRLVRQKHAFIIVFTFPCRTIPLYQLFIYNYYSAALLSLLEIIMNKVCILTECYYKNILICT